MIIFSFMVYTVHSSGNMHASMCNKVFKDVVVWQHLLIVITYCILSNWTTTKMFGLYELRDWTTVKGSPPISWVVLATHSTQPLCQSVADIVLAILQCTQAVTMIPPKKNTVLCHPYKTSPSSYVVYILTGRTLFVLERMVNNFICKRPPLLIRVRMKSQDCFYHN